MAWWKQVFCVKCERTWKLRRSAWLAYVTQHGDEPPCPKCHPKKRVVLKCQKCGKGLLSIRPESSGGDGLCGWCRRGRKPVLAVPGVCTGCKREFQRLPNEKAEEQLCGWCRRGRNPNPYGAFPCPACGESHWCFKSKADQPCRTCRRDSAAALEASKKTPTRTLPVAGPADPFNTRWITFPCCGHRMSTNYPLESITARTCLGCHSVFPKVQT